MVKTDTVLWWSSVILTIGRTQYSSSDPQDYACQPFPAQLFPCQASPSFDLCRASFLPLLVEKQNFFFFFFFFLLNYQLSQKLKLIGRGKFNHLINILTLPLTCGFKLSFNRWGPIRGIFNLNEGNLTESMFDLRTFDRTLIPIPC